MNQPELLPAEEAKRTRRRRGIIVRTIEEPTLTARDIHPPEEFRQLVAHDVDVHAKTMDDDVLYLDFTVTAGPKRDDSARMTIWAEIPRWLRWTGIKPVLGVRIERDF